MLGWKDRRFAIALLIGAIIGLSAAHAAFAADKPNIVVIMGDDIGIWNIGAYHRGHDGGPDAEPRQARQRGHAVHRLLRRGELHGRSGGLHHRRAAHPHRHDHGRPGRRQIGHARGGLHDRHRAQVHGLCHGPVRQEPPWRSQ